MIHLSGGSLDTLNTATTYWNNNGVTTYPHFRTTGMRLNVKIEYDNLKRGCARTHRRSIAKGHSGGVAHAAAHGAPQVASCALLSKCLARLETRPRRYASVFANPDVNAALNVEQDEIGWAGSGPETWFTEVPQPEDGAEKYSKLIRYRQGVVIKFVPSGFVYALDYTHLVSTLVAGFVLLNVAAILMDLVTFSRARPAR